MMANTALRLTAKKDRTRDRQGERDRTRTEIQDQRDTRHSPQHPFINTYLVNTFVESTKPTGRQIQPHLCPPSHSNQSSLPKVLLAVSFLAPLGMFLWPFPLCGGGVELGTAMARRRVTKRAAEAARCVFLLDPRAPPGGGGVLHFYLSSFSVPSWIRI